jgi:hypothetical protein
MGNMEKLNSVVFVVKKMGLTTGISQQLCWQCAMQNMCSSSQSDVVRKLDDLAFESRQEQ